MTIKDKLFEVLTSMGSQVVLATSKKYQKLTVPGEPEMFYWLGKAGALRKGRTVSESYSMEPLRTRLLVEWTKTH